MVDMNMLAWGVGDVFELWQIIPLVLLIGVIVFWMWYRKQQM